MFARAMDFITTIFKLKSCCLAFALLLGFGFSYGQNKHDQYRQQLDKVYSAEALAADIDHFRTALEAGHPDLYRYLPKSQFDSLLADLKQRSGGLTLRHFYNEINHIGSLIGCGHLMISYSRPLEKYFAKYAYFPPLHIIIGDGMAMVKKNQWGAELPKGAMVKSINGVAIDSLVSHINHYLARDGYTLAANDWLLFNGWFNLYYVRYWGDSLNYTYKYEILGDTTHTVHEVFLPGLNITTMSFRKTKRTKPEPQLTLTYDDATNTAILTVKSFDPIAIKKGRQKYTKFIHEAFWRIYQTQPEQLIIDLRDNEGGSSFYPEQIISYLSPEPFKLYRNMEIRYRSQKGKQQLLKIRGKRGYRRIEKQSTGTGNGNLAYRKFTDKLVYNFPYAYPGTVYVMVNGGTYSAASELACYLKEHMEAIVVGSETGGSCDPITAGMYGEATLPNTGIVIKIPLITFDKDIKQPRKVGCGLMPDIDMYPYENDLDSNLDYLLELIQQKQLEPRP